MRLLEEIVNLLSDKGGSLTDALLKTKVLMHRIGHKELAGWVNDELNGYPRIGRYRTIESSQYVFTVTFLTLFGGTQRHSCQRRILIKKCGRNSVSKKYVNQFRCWSNCRRERIP